MALVVDPVDLEILRRSADANRTKLRDQLRATRDRLTPDRLVDDAKSFAAGQVQILKDDTVAHIRRHPVRTALGATLLLAWIARRPIIERAPRMIGLGYGWLSGKLAFTQMSLSSDNDAEDGSEPEPEEPSTSDHSVADEEREDT